MTTSKWSVPFDQIARRANMSMAAAARTITMELFTEVISTTPVDTGRLKGNWFPSYGTFVGYSPDAPDKGGEATIRRMRQSVLSYPMGDVIWLTNSLPYATVVEYGMYPQNPKGGAGKTIGGFSTQAPQGMVRLAVNSITMRLSGSFPDIVRSS